MTHTQKNVIEWIILHVTAHMMKECLEVVYEEYDIFTENQL